MQTLYIIVTIFVFIFLIRRLFRRVLDLPNYSGKIMTEGSSIENLMEEQMFWQIVSEAKSNSNNNFDTQCQLLTDYLTKLTGQEIIQFNRTFEFLMAKTYSFRLWEPVYSLNGGCSDDCFEYFRSWLIGQGKNKFYWTIKYPRLLFLIGVKELIQNYEGLSYCALEAYENKIGGLLPQSDDIKYPDPGKIFDNGTAFIKYPGLALLAW